MVTEYAMTDVQYVDLLCKDSSVPEAWCGIVADCHRKMLATGIAFEVDQIKDKFGGLRFYFTVVEDDGTGVAFQKLENVVRQAEEAVWRL